ncbi:MAG: FKBP-type peptidyl-prolyl cis-trans isomerase [Solirubrobacterales bacterium]
MGRRLLIILACLALFAVGCGSNSSSTASSGASSTTAKTGEETAAAEESVSPAATKQAEAEAKKKKKPKVVPPKGPKPKNLVVKDLEVGTGPEAKTGDKLTVQYVGVGYESGTQFDSSWDRHEPFTFTLGEGKLIKGWEKGLEGMKVGGRRELITPPDYAYGSAGSGNIAPNATLVFVIDLLKVK